jgi:hypothetical protein
MPMQDDDNNVLQKNNVINIIHFKKGRLKVKVPDEIVYLVNYPDPIVSWCSPQSFIDVPEWNLLG